MEKIKKILKEECYLVEVILFLLIILFVALYVQSESSKKSVEIEKDAKIQQLEDKIESSEKQIAVLGKTEKQQELLNNINKLKAEQDNLTVQKQQLENEIKQKNEEIEKIKGEAIRVKGEPKTYPAGHLTVGTDIPEGKYKIYDGRSNFVVYSAYGELQVNTILGSSYGVSEYIYNFENGDKVRADSSFKLVAVE